MSGKRPNRELYATYLTPSEGAQLRQCAAAADRPLSAEIRAALRRHFRGQNDERPAVNEANVTTPGGRARHDSGY